MRFKHLLYGPVFSLSKAISRRNLYRWLDAHFQKIQTQSDLDVLNIGAAGPIPERLKSYSFNKLTNVDIDQAKKPDKVCDVCRMQDCFPDSSFDCVVIMEVLEHVTEPRLAISEIARVLRPGGYVVISVPFILPIHAEPFDYWRFTKYGLEYLLKEKFIKINIKERTLYNESIIVLLARLGMGDSGWRKFLPFIGVPLAIFLWPIAVLFDALTLNRRSTTGYFVTARKK